MKVRKHLARFFAFVLMLSVILPVVTLTQEHVEAASRLYGVQQVVDGLLTHDYTILEIVPDNAFKSFGYVVAQSVPELDDTHQLTV